MAAVYQTAGIVHIEQEKSGNGRCLFGQPSSVRVEKQQQAD
jgi:hypothetical protein